MVYPVIAVTVEKAATRHCEERKRRGNPGIVTESTWAFYINTKGHTLKRPVIYILANKKNGTLYTGVTSNIIQRVDQHKNELVDGFSKKYKCKHLVYVEALETMEQAILREKQIKSGSRKKKIELIENQNPEWKDLFDEICNEYY